MANTYSLIASNVLTSSTTTVTFSAIPSTYTDLVLRISARRDYMSATTFRLRFNGLTTSIYTFTNLKSDGTSATSARTASTGLSEPTANDGSTTASTFSSHEFYIPSYTGSFNKPMSAFSVAENNATAATMSVASYTVDTTASITDIELFAPNLNWVSGSSFYLYGIKNS